LRNWPRNASAPRGLKLNRVTAALKEKHAPIAHRFGTTFGFDLMRRESDLLLTVLRRLHRQGIHALPLHDAVLVGQLHAAAAKSVMEEAFIERYGTASNGLVEIEYPQENQQL
jgi:hypothetical protein